MNNVRSSILQSVDRHMRSMMPPTRVFVPHDMVEFWEKQGYVTRGVVVDDDGLATDKTEMVRAR